ncbi:MAG: hypothetical protein LUE20_05195 [Oscillospiraceae bacterium]|nr:hypothetical protein [Oscillospiraceae bacterium]
MFDLGSIFGNIFPLIGLAKYFGGKDDVTEIHNDEGIEYSKEELERVSDVSDVMGEVFTDDIISNWENLSDDERIGYINEYLDKAGETLGIEVGDVIIEDLQAKYGEGTMGMNNGDGNVYIDITRLDDLEDLLTTTTHEMRHQFQKEVMENPDAFPGISDETIEQWEYEYSNYIKPGYDYEGYYNQAIEADARAFADEVVSDFLIDKGVEELSVEAPDSPEAFEAEMETDADEAMALSDEVADASFEADSETNLEQAENLDGSNNSDVGVSVDDGLNKGETTETFSNGACDKLCLKCKVEVGFRT